MLRLSDIRKQYVTASETVDALKGICISFRKSEFVSILGPSGCGKTTLLNIIGGLDHYTSGDLVISGKSTKDFTDRDWDVYRNHRIGFIFQSYNLIPHQTILGNVELALTIAGIDRAQRIEKAKKALDRVGLAGQYYKHPNQLSGGQCQRVAIARALVNDPEILLADEPTGALDTVTSVQIMDLIRDISSERLVIMVTHNPELAEKYSSRIVRLLDGNIVEDTLPFTEEEEIAECAASAIAEERKASEEQAENTSDSEKKEKKQKKPKKEKAEMSFFTAFMLSARNLISKRGRTAMVGFAGSIGIIGIALVLAFSAGIKGYVNSMQDDLLSGNPIGIERASFDLDSVSSALTEEEKAEIIKEPNRVYINSKIRALIEMNKIKTTAIVRNEITEEYIDYILAMPDEYLSAMLVDYGIDMTASIYTDFYQNGEDASPDRLSLNMLGNLYAAIFKDNAELKDYASYLSGSSITLSQAPDNMDYVATQYDLLAGDYPESKNEIMLVVNTQDELSDLLLARFGYFNGEEFLEFASSDEESAKAAGIRDSFSYEELLGKSLYWYPNDTIYTVKTKTITTSLGSEEKTTVTYHYDAADFTTEETGEIELKVVGILSAKETVSYGCLQTGMYYTSELAEEIVSQNKSSAIVSYYQSLDASDVAAPEYVFDYVFGEDYYNGESTLGSYSSGLGSYASILSTFSQYLGGDTAESIKTSLLASLGGSTLPTSVSIYPKSFEAKDSVTAYLDAWNESEDPITVNGVTYAKEERVSVEYTDTLSLVIDMITTMVDVVSYALIAFTSVSLVVSTVMIGIITYVSVVERIKEIGVIRALGGRKRDVRHLFNAETFIIGLLAGLIGVVATYLISEIVNLILYPLTDIRHLAQLPLYNAVEMILLSVGLTLISGLIPASSAAKKDPVVALRTE